MLSIHLFIVTFFIKVLDNSSASKDRKIWTVFQPWSMWLARVTPPISETPSKYCLQAVAKYLRQHYYPTSDISARGSYPRRLSRCYVPRPAEVLIWSLFEIPTLARALVFLPLPGPHPPTIWFVPSQLK